ncbi:MAG: PhoH family protein [Gammaproteobacteria bacterium]
MALTLSNKTVTDLKFTPIDNHRLASLRGHHDIHLRQVEKTLKVEISDRGNHFQISGDPIPVAKAQEVLKKLYEQTNTSHFLSSEEVHLQLRDTQNSATTSNESSESKEVNILTKAGNIRGRTSNQRLYLQNIQKYDINFGIGPAGTGKTYLAVAAAVSALETQQVQRILLVRPAVEAGERLGFLPGDLAQKIEPYLRPLYDALFEMMGFERVAHLIEQNIIEIAPLAYMRGRTLNDAFVILDESQNTTTEQMKMFLTRVGFGSKAIITGDITQIDLPKGKKSGLMEAIQVLEKITGICFTYFDSKDVVRHPLVQQIIEAYNDFDQSGDNE